MGVLVDGNRTRASWRRDLLKGHRTRQDGKYSGLNNKSSHCSLLSCSLTQAVTKQQVVVWASGGASTHATHQPSTTIQGPH